MIKKPKIAILVPRYGIVERGVETFTRDFIRHLNKDFDIDIFTRRNTLAISAERIPKLPSFLDKFHLDAVELEMLSFSIFVFPKLLIKDYDIIFPQNGLWGAFICKIVRFLKQTPFIYVSAGGKEPLIVRTNPNCYVATTPVTFEWIKNYQPQAKVRLIPLGANLKMFSPSVSKIKIGLEKPLFLCVAALVPSKRISLAIKAVAKLKKGSLLVLGEGVLEEKLKKMGNNLLGTGRFRIQRVNHNIINKYYSSSDIFTLPSLDEPFGVVYLEALASGLPVVAPDDESRKYIVGRAGILCDVTNNLEYSKALGRAALKKFGDVPRIQASNFSWDIISERFKDLLNTIIYK